MNPFAVVILAAGLSRRMGQFKPLLPIGGETFAGHLIATFLDCGIEVYLVVGHRQSELRAAVTGKTVTFVENPDYERGMFTSVQAGVRALRQGYSGFFVMPADIPLVRETTIRALMTRHAEQPGDIIYPVCGGKRGHPPLIPMGLAPVIAAWTPQGNLRAVLDSYDRPAREVTVDDENILLDIDTAADYALLVERYSRQQADGGSGPARFPAT